MNTAGFTQKQMHEIEAAIVAAYERGAQWGRDNPHSVAWVKKAARDYADKATSPESR